MKWKDCIFTPTMVIRLYHQFLRIAGFLSLILLLAGCKKNKAPVICYTCIMQYANGNSAGTQYPCTSNIASWQKAQKDNNGQSITSTCVEQ